MNQPPAAPEPITGTLPREITVERIPDGMRYRLPGRQLGVLRFIGLVPVLFGVCFAIVPFGITRALWRDALSRPSIFHLVVFGFLLVFLFPAFKAIGFGMLILCGRCTVELRRDWLRAIDSAGPFRKVRKARIADVRRFEVTVGDGKTLPGFLQPMQNMGGLDAKFDDAKPMPVALGYPREWMLALGNELSRQVTDVNVVRSQPALPPAAEIVKILPSQVPAPTSLQDVTTKPTSSEARLEETPQGATLVLPPRGLRRGGRGLLGFGIIWCLFMLVFTSVFVFSGTKKSHPPIVPFVLFISLFWGVGALMILGAINMARRRGILIATDSDLRVAQESLFGKKAWTWSRDQIMAVRADRSGVEVNNQPLIELQVHTLEGKKTGLFRGRDEAELQWIATILRARLQVPAKEGA